MSRTRAWLAWLVVALVAVAGSPAVAGVPQDTVGVVNQSSGIWYLRGPAGDTTSFYYGNPGDLPFVGDWDCDGVDTPGLYRQSDGYVYLRNSNSQGIADIRFFFGNPGDVPIAGDFDADGCDTVAIYRPSEARIYVINELGSNGGGLGAADFDFYFGNQGDKPFTGDFNNNGQDTVGLHRESTGFVYYRNTLTTGIADDDFFYGDPGDQIVTGRWAQDPTPGSDTVGIFRPSSGYVYLRFSNTQGIADVDFPYGNRDMSAVAGAFGVLPGGDREPPRDGALDLSFGLDGAVFTDLDMWLDEARAVAVQRDGKIVVAGRTIGELDWEMVLVRYNSDGSLDLTFGVGGITVTDSGGTGAPVGLAIQPDGKIVVARLSRDKSSVLVRYDQNGRLDQTFSAGTVPADLAGGFSVESLALQRDGRIVVSGIGAPQGAGILYGVLVMRFSRNGTLDPTFGGGGVVHTAGGSGAAVAIQADGKIIAAGGVQTSFVGCAPYDPCDSAFVVVRYNTDGSIDSSFGVGGKATTGRPGESNVSRDVVIQPDGKIVVVGGRDTRPVAYSNFVAARYNPDGSLDSSFGASGEVVTDFGGEDDARAVALQPDGKIVAAGLGGSSDPVLDPDHGWIVSREFAVARYHPDGTLDRSFGIGGKVLVDVGPSTFGAHAMALQRDGNVVVAGRGGDQLGAFALVRLMGATTATE